jgi:predicted ester cyclase
MMNTKEIVSQLYCALSSGDTDLARRLVAPEWNNRMKVDEPPPSARPGPAGFLATSAWLRHAFSNLRFEETDSIAEGEWVASRVRMIGRHKGPFIVFPPGKEAEVFPPTGRTVDVFQCHLHRFRNNQTIEHIAVRDDLGMMMQLGYIPPNPITAARLFVWRVSGRAKRAAKRVIEIAEEAAKCAE